jgi:hypothetical protein
MDAVALGKLRSVAKIFEVRLVLEARWRGAELDRFVGSRHASMSEAVTRLLVDAGWEVRPEVSFNHFGERGVVDLVAWHPGTRTVLLIELKTELADINSLLGTTDRRRRLAQVIVGQFRWNPVRVAQWVVVAESRTNRRRLAEHRTLLRLAFPADGRSLAGWLAKPDSAVSALWFLPDSAGGSNRQRRAPTLRVSGTKSNANRLRQPANR